MARSNAVAQVTGELFEDGWSKVRGSMQGLGAKRQQMVRAARGGRSAVFKAIRSGGTHTKGQLMNQLEYLTTKSSHIVDSRGVLDGKTRLSADEIKSVADRFTERWDKGFNPKMGHTTHLLMSFPVGTRGADVRDIASDVAERFFATEDRNFDYLIAVHEDRAHPHAHVVLNRRSQEGEFFYLGRDHHFNYDDFRTAMVEEAEKYGVSLEATRRLDRGVVTYTPRTREIYAAKEQGREPVGRPIEIVEVQFGKGDAGLRRSPGDHGAPGVDHHGVAIAGPFARRFGMCPHLGRGNHVALRLDRAGAQHAFPVVLAGFHVEGGRQDDQVTAVAHMGQEQLGKAQVVADGAACAAARDAVAGDGVAPVDHVGFAEDMARGRFDVEEVDLDRKSVV